MFVYSSISNKQLWLPSMTKMPACRLALYEICRFRNVLSRYRLITCLLPQVYEWVCILWSRRGILPVKTKSFPALHGRFGIPSCAEGKRYFAQCSSAPKVHYLYVATLVIYIKKHREAPDIWKNKDFSSLWCCPIVRFCFALESPRNLKLALLTYSSHLSTHFLWKIIWADLCPSTSKCLGLTDQEKTATFSNTGHQQ